MSSSDIVCKPSHEGFDIWGEVSNNQTYAAPQQLFRRTPR